MPILGIIANGLDLLNVSPYWQYVIKGTVIGLAVGVDVFRSRHVR